jgi:hypothetical protein
VQRKRCSKRRKEKKKTSGQTTVVELLKRNMTVSKKLRENLLQLA